MGFCSLPPDRVKLAVNRKKETNSRVKMGQESRWASVIYSLKESKWDKCHFELLLFTPWQSQTNSEQQGQNGLLLFTPCLRQTNSEQQEKTNSRVKMDKESNGPTVRMGFCYLPPERVKMGLLLFTPWQSQTSSEQQERNKQQHQNGQRAKTSVIYLLKESNSEQQERNKQQGQNGPRVKIGFCYLPPERVKMGQRSLWAAVVYPLTEWN